MHRKKTAEKSSRSKWAVSGICQEKQLVSLREAISDRPALRYGWSARIAVIEYGYCTATLSLAGIYDRN